MKEHFGTTNRDEEEKYENSSADHKASNIEISDENVVGDIGPNIRILLFTNPPQSNLCFSNSTASLLLNIPNFKFLLEQKSEEMEIYSRKNAIVREFIYLQSVPNFTKIS